MSKTRFVIAAVALAGTLVAGLAQARSSSDVQWSVTIGSPVGVPVYTQPVPVYTQPVPVYSRPVPVYTRHVPVYTQPAPVVHYPRIQPYPQYRQPTRWDRDGDGIPNRRDRLYNPRWDRDGDGIPNHRDRADNRRHDRDGDGVPNRYDRRDDRYGHGRGR
ncbi:MAG TPA: hypothetical protein VGE16_09170 [Albitalea sp.]